MAGPADTIFALSTPRGRGAIAVIRLSGPQTQSALRALAGAVPEPRRARLARLSDPLSGEPLDRAVLLFFPGPRSFSGEDMAEIQAHGGRAVIQALLESLVALPGLRPAEPGEFTRRAFHNGRLDLTEIEGLSDLISAETAAQRRQALRQLDGGLAVLIESWRTALKRLMAAIEAEIDFPDEDLGVSRTSENAGALNRLRKEIAGHLDGAKRGERLRDGYRVALVGAPNMGKSSLLNALAKREVAIVSDEPGTTRDVLELHLDLSGYPVILSDMAGLRPDAEKIKSIGVAKAKARAEDADLRLFLIDAAPPAPLPAYIETLKRPGDMLLRTKSDLREDRIAAPDELAISAISGAGLPALLTRIEASAIDALGRGDAPLFTRLRHRTALAETLACLTRAAEAWADAPPELVAEDLRLAGRTLARITGRIDVEEILDIVFAEFCIGK